MTITHYFCRSYALAPLRAHLDQQWGSGNLETAVRGTKIVEEPAPKE
ncbi:hypothetical protein [Streptomyces sp. JNUCC 63]